MLLTIGLNKLEVQMSQKPDSLDVLNVGLLGENTHNERTY